MCPCSSDFFWLHAIILDLPLRRKYIHEEVVFVYLAMSYYVIHLSGPTW